MKEDEEEVEGKVLEYYGDEVIIMPVVCPRGLFSIFSLSNFCLVVLLLKFIITPFLSCSEHAILNSFQYEERGGYS